LESQMEEAARQMNGLLARVTSMNRDLNFDETRYSDQGDRNEWAEARRWLREGAGRLSRYLREQQLSVTFSDAKRKWCEQTYQKFIVPRVQFEGIERADREFEAHRRALQSLLNNMKSALTYASEDALRRAQRVQTKIAAKVRAAQTKRP